MTKKEEENAGDTTSDVDTMDTASAIVSAPLSVITAEVVSIEQHQNVNDRYHYESNGDALMTKKDFANSCDNSNNHTVTNDSIDNIIDPLLTTNDEAVMTYKVSTTTTTAETTTAETTIPTSMSQQRSMSNHNHHHHSNNEDEALNHHHHHVSSSFGVLPFSRLRTNRAPPTMAFLLRKNWKKNILWNRFNSNSRQSDGNDENDGDYTPQDSELDNNELRPDHAITDSEHNSDLTTTLLSSSQSPQLESTMLFDRFYHKYCKVWQLLLDPETHEHIQRTIRRSGNYIAYCTVLMMLIVVPAVLYRSLTNERKLDIAAIHSARVMVLGTFIMSLRLVYLHLTHWYMPDVQKYVVRILWMVPIYAIQSYLSLRYHHARVYMSTIRDFYEAFVITSFVYYLMELLGGQDSLIHVLQHKDPRYGYHKFPISLVLQPWVVGEEFLLQCKHGVLQYVVFKTTATILIFICEYCGVYGEGRFEWFVAYPYLCFFQNISVMYALYCLVIFFHACNEELHSPVNWHPLGKFLCIKGVVFFTWWQGVIIFYLRDHGIIGSMGSWQSIDVANGFIDYCIVVEMVGFAIAHSYTFTYTEYLPGRFPTGNATPTTTTSTNEASVENEFSRALLSNNDSDENCTPRPSLLQSQQHHPTRVQLYRPPATLPERMRFRDALWSSSVPHETLQDIRRLRAGVLDSVMNQQLQSLGLSRGISLSAFINSDGSDNNNIDEEELVGGGRNCDPEVEHPSPDPESEI